MTNKPLNLLQWNARNIKANSPALEQYLQQNPQFNILAISETHLKPSEPFRLSNLIAYRADRQNCPRGGRGGAALFLSPDLPAHQIYFHSQLEVVAVRVILQGKITTVISIYIPPDGNRNTEMTELFAQITHPAIICGDFNAHSTKWGAAHSNQRGRKLAEIADKLGFTVLNNGQPTLMPTPNSNPTAPDTTLVSDQLQDAFDWQVVPQTLGSDHHLIQITSPLQQINSRITQQPPQRDFEKADWSKYKKQLGEDDFSSQNLPPKDEYEALVRKMNSAANNTIPWKRPPMTSSRSNKKPWWNAECEQAYTEMLKANEEYRHDTASKSKYINTKRCAALFKRISKEAKRECWRNFCNTINSQTPTSRIWRTIKKLKNQESQSPSPTLNSADWEEAFVDRIAPEGNTVSSTLDWHALQGTQIRHEHSFNDEPFTISELHLALATVNKKATPGPDNISYTMLLNLPESAKWCLLRIFNKFMANSQCPDEWKIAWLKPLLKPAQPKGEEKSYRPIMYTSCVAKLFETLIKRRLMNFLEINKIIPKSQHAYRKGYNAQMCLTDLVTSINLSWAKNQIHFALMLDVKGAFDNVQHSPLLKELFLLGLPEKLIKWLEEFFKNRSLMFHSNEKGLIKRMLFKGVPQGGVLSSIFYTLYVRSLGNHTNSVFDLLQYSDDVLAHCGHHNIEVARKLLKEAFEAQFEFYAELGLELNIEKSLIMLFTHKKIIFPEINTKYGTLKVSDSARYLGIILDSKLLWKQQIDNLEKRCKSPMNIIKSVACVSWGAEPACLLKIYRALILSKLQNSAFLWQQANEKSRKQLDFIQNSAMRKILGALHSTPIHSMQAETNLLPLSFAARLEAERLVIKLFQCEDNEVLRKMREFHELTKDKVSNNKLQMLMTVFRKWSNDASRIPRTTHHCYQPPQNVGRLIFNPQWAQWKKNEMPPHAKQIILETLNTTFKGYTHVYTDASKRSDGAAGAAVYSSKPKKALVKRLPDTYSILSAEAAAFLNALTLIKQNNTKGPWLICTDSKSLLSSLANYKSCDSKNFIISDIRRTIHEILYQQVEIQFLWIPSHFGLHGNEIADRLAKFSCRAPPTTSCTPVTDLTRVTKHDIHTLWETQWRQLNLNKGKDYAKVCETGHLPTSPWFYKFPANTRSFYTSINRIRFAHAPTPDRLHAWNVRQSPACLCSHPLGSLEHLLLDCKLFAQKRQTLLESLLALKVPQPYNLQHILAAQNPKIYKALHELFSHIFSN
jgi:ribonuclease HI